MVARTLIVVAFLWLGGCCTCKERIVTLEQKVTASEQEALAQSLRSIRSIIDLHESDHGTKARIVSELDKAIAAVEQGNEDEFKIVFERFTKAMPATGSPASCSSECWSIYYERIRNCAPRDYMCRIRASNWLRCCIARCYNQPC